MYKSLCRLWAIGLVLLLAFGTAFLSTERNAEAATARKADIVFVIDTTGSMGGVIQNVKNNVSQFVDMLANNNISARLGLVTFKDIYNEGEYSTHNFGWYADPNSFKGTLGGIAASGGGDAPESAVDGLEEARRMSYQPLSKKFIILVTDITYKEGTRFDTPSNPITMAKETTLLSNDNIVVSVVVPSTYLSNYANLYQSTGGIYSDISTAFSSNLQDLVDMINTNTAPTLTVKSPAPNQIVGQTGTLLVPQISVSDSNGDTLVGSYYVDAETKPRDSKSISNTTTAQLITFNGLSFNGLTEGKHTLRLEVTDNWAEPVSQNVSFQIDKSPPAISAVNVAPADTSLTVTGTAADGGAGLAALPYRYQLGNATSPWTNVAYTFAGLTPNTAYILRTEVQDKLSHIAAKQQTVYTAAQAPNVAMIGSADHALSVKLSDSNPANTQYQMKVGQQYVDANGKLTSAPAWFTPVNKQMEISGLTANTPYNIQAIARNQAGLATNWGVSITGTTTAAPPVQVTATATQTSISLNWPTTAGIAGYDVDADGIVLDNAISASYTHTGLSPETSHTYRVRIRNAGGAGSWSEPIHVSTLPYPPVAPSNMTATPTGQTHMQIAWDAVVKADRYELEADGEVIVVGGVTTYTHTGLVADTPHNYRVRAVNAGGASGWSEAVTASTLPNPPETPAGLQGEPSIHSIALSWGVSERAVSYEIEVDGAILSVGAATTYSHEELLPLSNHSYLVRAVNIGGKSPWSDPIEITTHPEIPDIPANIMTTSDEASITLTWYEVPHTETYEVELGSGEIQPVTEAHFEQIGLTPDTVYSYRIRARNISGESEWSAPVKMATLPLNDGTTPVSLTNIVAIVTNKAVTLSWDTVAPNARYEVEADGVLIDNGEETIFQDAGLSANEFHLYKIRLQGEDQAGDWVAILALSTLPNPPDAPTGLQADAADDSIELHWEKADGATGYDVEVDGQLFSVDGNATYLHEGLEPGTSHDYRVRAKNMSGVTAWSPAMSKSTTSPTFAVDAEAGVPFDLGILARNVQDFGSVTFAVTYDPDQLELIDLYDYTPEYEIASGKIPGSPLTALVEPGRIIFTVDRNVVPGTSWSGEISTLLFSPKVSGEITIDVTAQ